MSRMALEQANSLWNRHECWTRHERLVWWWVVWFIERIDARIYMKAKFRQGCDLARCCPDNGHFPRFNFLQKPTSDIDTYENTVVSKKPLFPWDIVKWMQVRVLHRRRRRKVRSPLKPNFSDTAMPRARPSVFLNQASDAAQNLATKNSRSLPVDH